MASEWTTLTVEGSSMKTYVAVPSGTGPFPAVVVAQHAGGVDSFIQSVCDRLAEAGYAAAAPDQYHRQTDMTFEELAAIPREDPDRFKTMIGKAQQTTDLEITTDINTAIAHLQSLPIVGSSAVGVMGFCGGGRVAYMMAARNSALSAAAVFHGGSIMGARQDQPSPFDLTPQISCKVAGFFGWDDGNPSPDDVAKISAEMDKHDKEHEFHLYDGTGHSFLDHTSPNSYREKSAVDAWEKLMTFFGENLKAPVAAG
jgi:carboxymethylenebutenolidase